MEINKTTGKIKEFFKDKNSKFREIKGEKKVAIIVGIASIILALIFGVKYINDSKYKLLFSGLSSSDANAITKELESQNVEMKIKGDSIYVPKDDVDKLRLNLSGSLSNGSKGFELMDETSSFGLTDEEFNIKKQRMIQGEIEKTIKTFKQVEDARVSITQGEKSVFSDEGIPGSAAVTLTLKLGETLEISQVRSIISLVSASSTNIPKQNVEVVDQNMNLLSYGVFDENGNASSSNGIEVALKAEKELSQQLESSIISLLEPIFGEGKVKVTVYADLNFDSNEITDIVINPETVVMSESKSENKTTDIGNTGGAVDNNMNNVATNNEEIITSKEESTEYDAGRRETKTIKSQGELNKVTASVAIDKTLTAAQIRDVNDMVANTIGIDEERGDNVKVVSMKFDTNNNEEIVQESETADMFKLLGVVLLSIVIAGIIAFVIVSNGRKKKNAKEIEEDDEDEIELINKKIQEMESVSKVIDEEEPEITLEEEVRKYASENPERVTDLINSWLNI